MQFLLMIRIKTILSVLLEKNRPTSPAAEGSETLKSQNLFVVDLGLWNHDTSAIMLDSDSVDRAIIELCTQFQSIVIELLKLRIGANTFCALVHFPIQVQFTFICGRQRTLVL